MTTGTRHISLICFDFIGFFLVPFFPLSLSCLAHMIRLVYVFWNDIMNTIIISIAIDVCPILQLSRLPFTEDKLIMSS